jgi:hypothetical protein
MAHMGATLVRFVMPWELLLFFFFLSYNAPAAPIGNDDVLRFVAANGEMILARDQIAQVEKTFDSNGLPAISIRLIPSRTDELGDLTSQHIGEKMALFVCDKLISEPVIQSAITGGSIMLTGGRDGTLLPPDAFDKLLSGDCG